MPNFREIRRDIAGQIGYNVAFLTADDENLHLDTPDLLFSFAGLLITSYCIGFVEAAVKDFKNLGEASWELISEKIKKLRNKSPQQEYHEEQEAMEEEIFLAFHEVSISLKERGIKTDNYVSYAIDCTYTFAKENNFPAEKARKLASALQERIGQ
jgi:hypothetical protein